MLYTTVFAVLAAAGVSAVPIAEISQVHGPSTFSVGTIMKPNHVKNGKAAMARAHAKYGSTKFQKRQDGTIGANPDVEQGGDLEYTCKVLIGSTGQTLNLDFDTGSADLWVFSSLQPASQKSGHNIYTPSKSSSYKALSGYSWSISYGDGSGASGSVARDVVKIGATTVTNQAVELAKTVSSQFVSSFNDGLVGLAFSSINTVSPTPQKTFFDNAKPNLQSPLFAAYLKHAAVGSYDFGYIDSTKYTGALTYAAVDNSQGFWAVDSASYKVGSQVYTNNDGQGIADTGTTLLLMGDDVVSRYYSKVSGATNDQTQGGYIFPCSATLPSFSIKIGSSYATIPGKLMNYAPVDSTGKS